MMVLQWSCATNEPLIDAKNDSDASSNSTQFDIIPGMNYIVDGKKTAERDLLVATQRNAWNVHFDFPENKVVISTTEKEFNRYVNSNEEFKIRLEENTREAMNPRIEETFMPNSSVSSSRVSATPTLRVDYSNTAFFNISYKPSDATKIAHYTFAATNNFNVFKGLQQTNKTTPSQATATSTLLLLNQTQGNSAYKVAIRNSKESGVKTITFYTGESYGGTVSKTYSINPNSTQIIPSTLVYKSYK